MVDRLNLIGEQGDRREQAEQGGVVRAMARPGSLGRAPHTTAAVGRLGMGQPDQPRYCGYRAASGRQGGAGDQNLEMRAHPSGEQGHACHLPDGEQNGRSGN